MECDRCGKRAALLVTRNNSQLSFCGHHALEARTKLEQDGWAFNWIEEDSYWEKVRVPV